MSIGSLAVVNVLLAWPKVSQIALSLRYGEQAKLRADRLLRLGLSEYPTSLLFHWVGASSAYRQ